MSLPFSKEVIKDLLDNSGMTLSELETDYENHISEPESHDGEFSNDWTKNQ